MTTAHVRVEHLLWQGPPRPDGMTEHWRLALRDEEGETAILLTAEQLRAVQAAINQCVSETLDAQS